MTDEDSLSNYVVFDPLCCLRERHIAFFLDSTVAIILVSLLFSRSRLI
jgi:hypothetical protein